MYLIVTVIWVRATVIMGKCGVGNRTFILYKCNRTCHVSLTACKYIYSMNSV